MNFDELLRLHAEKLTETDKEILSFILENKTLMKDMKIKDLADVTHSSTSTIVRLTKKLGMTGYSELKFSLNQTLDRKKHAEVWSLTKQKQDIEATYKLISQTNFSSIIEHIYKAEMIYFYGTGFSQKNSLIEVSQAFMTLKKRVLMIPAKHEFDMNMTMITKQDLVVIASLSGETEDIKTNIDMLKI